MFVFATRAWKSAGVQKFRTYLQYLDLYPESKFVFVGDNGQADSFAAEIMANLSLMPEAEVATHNKSLNRGMRKSIQFADYGKQFVAAFIHKVQAIPHTLTHYADALKVDHQDWIREREKDNIYFFETYVEAALKAYGAKPEPLLTLEDLYDIGYAAVVDCWNFPSRTHYGRKEVPAG